MGIERISIKTSKINKKVSILFPSNKANEGNFKSDVRKGLLAKQKYLLPKYFYDETGSKLFNDICKLKEYYVTRTESRILKDKSYEIMTTCSDAIALVELGSGSSEKTRFLIESNFRIKKSLHYIPIDISDILISSSQKLSKKYSKLKITGILCDYQNSLRFINQIDPNPKLIIFLGTSIGNYTKRESIQLLKLISRSMNPMDFLLMGFDLIKDIKKLTSAYNDKKGITAKFNINVLTRMNKELGANFNVKNFYHNAFYNIMKNRIEMHIISKINQEVFIKSINRTIYFRKGESIHTENSYKFNDKIIINMAKLSNLKFIKSWKDKNNYFSLCLFKKIINHNKETRVFTN